MVAFRSPAGRRIDFITINDPTSPADTPERDCSRLPATRFTAARQLAYRASQKLREALPDESYASYFERGEVGSERRAS
jgi:hypothetical protein